MEKIRKILIKILADDCTDDKSFFQCITEALIEGIFIGLGILIIRAIVSCIIPLGVTLFWLAFCNIISCLF